MPDISVVNRYLSPMNLIKPLFIFCFALLLSTGLSAKEGLLNNFIVKEDLLKNSRIAVIAADDAGIPIDSVNGTLQFSVNGFSQALRFHDGVAVVPLQIDKSAFVYLKHSNDEGTHSKLYYVWKTDINLHPYAISWIWLLIIPGSLVLLGFLFRRFIIIAIVLFVILVYFNHHSGLDIARFFETVFDGLRSMVSL